MISSSLSLRGGTIERNGSNSPKAAAPKLKRKPHNQNRRGKTLARTQKVVPLTIYVTPVQKMMLDGITRQKRTNVSVLLRSVIDEYVRYMDRAFMHPAEQDVMAKLQKMEDRLVRLNLKGLHATGRILYLVSAAWKMGRNDEPLTEDAFETLMDKSKVSSREWLQNFPSRPKKEAS